MTDDLTRQDMKADARKSAEMAPPADPDTAARALAEAESRSSTVDGSTRQQPVYKTQGDDVAGDNAHRGKDAIISEFDSPAENTVHPGA